MQHDAHVQSRIAHLDDTIRKVDEVLVLRDKQITLLHELRAALEHARDGAYLCPLCKGSKLENSWAKRSAPCRQCDGTGRYRPETVER